MEIYIVDICKKKINSDGIEKKKYEPNRVRQLFQNKKMLFSFEKYKLIDLGEKMI